MARIRWTGHGGYRGFAGVAKPSRKDEVSVEEGATLEVTEEQLSYFRASFATEFEIVEEEESQGPTESDSRPPTEKDVAAPPRTKVPKARRKS